MAEQDVALLSAVGGFIVLVFATTLFHGIVVLPGILFSRPADRRCSSAAPRGADHGVRHQLQRGDVADLPAARRTTSARPGIAGFVLAAGRDHEHGRHRTLRSGGCAVRRQSDGHRAEPAQQAVVFFTAMIASTGAPGIPSAGMVTMVMVLQAVGLPAEAVAILLPIDRLLDTVRTAVNVEGDIIGSVVVQRFADRG